MDCPDIKVMSPSFGTWISAGESTASMPEKRGEKMRGEERREGRRKGGRVGGREMIIEDSDFHKIALTCYST